MSESSRLSRKSRPCSGSRRIQNWWLRPPRSACCPPAGNSLPSSSHRPPKGIQQSSCLSVGPSLELPSSIIPPRTRLFLMSRDLPLRMSSRFAAALESARVSAPHLSELPHAYSTVLPHSERPSGAHGTVKALSQPRTGTGVTELSPLPNTSG